MKLIYCIHSIYNPGGMERVMLNKIRFLHEKGGYDITIVTTNQQGRPPFYPIPQGIRLVDLDINYVKVPFKSIIRTIGTFLWKRHLHKKRLKALLMKENADIVLSLYPSESSFIPSIKDGSKKVLELHGSIHRNFCRKCGKSYDAWYVKNSEGVPQCECGGIIKPDVVLYEEGLDPMVIDESIREISRADTLIIGGTSLVVYPAAGFIDYFRGKHLVVINKSATARGVGAELTINAPIGEIMSRIQVK